MSHKSFLVPGAIKADFIAKKIASHQSKTDIGAHAIFLGQVRADKLENSRVAAIEYSAYDQMADEAVHQIREQAFANEDISCLHIYHSIGLVKSGEISLFVFVSSAHRKASLRVMENVVERIKAEVPIWKKEISSDEEAHWVDG